MLQPVSFYSYLCVIFKKNYISGLLQFVKMSRPVFNFFVYSKEINNRQSGFVSNPEREYSCRYFCHSSIYFFHNEFCGSECNFIHGHSNTLCNIRHSVGLCGVLLQTL